MPWKLTNLRKNFFECFCTKSLKMLTPTLEYNRCLKLFLYANGSVHIHRKLWPKFPVPTNYENTTWIHWRTTPTMDFFIDGFHQVSPISDKLFHHLLNFWLSIEAIFVKFNSSDLSFTVWFCTKLSISNVEYWSAV